MKESLEERIPRHIAIIMDGNGRWAKKRGMPKLAGHRYGVRTIERVVKACIEVGVSYLTLYAFSTENWNRPKNEVESLLRLLETQIDNKNNFLNNI